MRSTPGKPAHESVVSLVAVSRDRPAGRATFRYDIEGLRAVAIILVLLYHAQIQWFPGGFVGVDVFFVISGFLITTSLLQEARTTGTIHLRAFYARRIRRLLPASALVLIGTGLAVLVTLPPTMWRPFGGDIAAAGGYVVNWRLASRAVDYLAQDVVPSPVQHFWSLSIEEQFYLIWPALILGALAFAARSQRSPRLAIGVALLAIVGVPSLAWSVILTGVEPPAAFFATTTRLWELATGALVAVVGIVRISADWLRLFVKLAGLAMVIGASVLIDASVQWPGTVALVPVLGTALLVVTGGKGDDVIERALASRPMRSIGSWSYSLYLWHWPPLAIIGARWGGLTTVQAVLITLASMAPAIAAYRWVETPLRFSRSLQESSRLTLRVGAVLTAMAIVTGLGVAFAQPRSVGPGDSLADAAGARVITGESDADLLLEAANALESITPSPANATEDRPSLYAEGCQVDQTDSEPILCERGDTNGDRLVVVIGDSKAGQWEPAWDILGARNDWRVLFVTKSACELTVATPAHMGEPYASCEDWNQRVLALVASVNPDLVLVSQGSVTAWNNETGEEDRGEMIAGMLGAYERVVAGGASLVIVLDNPHPGIVVRDCVATEDDLGACAVPLHTIEKNSARAVQLEVAELGSYETLDMLDLVCPDGLCLPVIGGVLVYRDGSHLTATYVLSMVDMIEERIEELVPDPFS